jgi:hypothetical protein
MHGNDATFAAQFCYAIYAVQKQRQPEQGEGGEVILYNCKLRVLVVNAFFYFCFVLR